MVKLNPEERRNFLINNITVNHPRIINVIEDDVKENSQTPNEIKESAPNISYPVTQNNLPITQPNIVISITQNNTPQPPIEKKKRGRPKGSFKSSNVTEKATQKNIMEDMVKFRDLYYVRSPYQEPTEQITFQFLRYHWIEQNPLFEHFNRYLNQSGRKSISKQLFGRTAKQVFGRCFISKLGNKIGIVSHYYPWCLKLAT
jgi:hypothetical protein